MAHQKLLGVIDQTQNLMRKCVEFICHLRPIKLVYTPFEVLVDMLKQLLEDYINLDALLILPRGYFGIGF